MLSRDSAALPRILRDNGYSTATFGKWHLTPDGQQGPAGPFDRWPNGWGFDYFWGILGGGSSQWDRLLAENQKIIGTDPGFYDPDDPFYFPDAMADPRLVGCTGYRRAATRTNRSSRTSRPDAVTPRTMSRRSGPTSTRESSIRDGTSSGRRRHRARSSSASSPPTASSRRATPRSRRGTTFPGGLQGLLPRPQMEVYAGYSENADYNVGRVIDAIDELGELDNTLIIWIWGDNGASMEGTITGSFNELTMQNGIPLNDEMQLALAEQYGGLDAWGGAIMDPHYSAAWAWAGNTPFQWGKQVGSHLGGTRNPLVVHWPERIHDTGGLRSQFAHVIDVAPMILDVAGIPEPQSVDGIEQEPMQRARPSPLP